MGYHGYHGNSPVLSALSNLINHDFRTIRGYPTPAGERLWKGLLRARRPGICFQASSSAAVGTSAASRAAEAAAGATLSGTLRVL